MHKSLSVVIPVYNGALSVGELVSQLHALLPTLAERYEIVLVEDDGRDNSWDVIEALAAATPETVRGIRMARNFGQQNAILCAELLVAQHKDATPAVEPFVTLHTVDRTLHQPLHGLAIVGALTI